MYRKERAQKRMICFERAQSSVFVYQAIENIATVCIEFGEKRNGELLCEGASLSPHHDNLMRGRGGGKYSF
jgi:hypothetical protein